MDKETILIVDDEKEIGDLIEVYLKNEGFNVIKASNGLEALEEIKEFKVDLIILDVMMPGMDGLQACIKIRESNPVPIIMLSAKNEDIDKILGLSTGADDYMSKPFNPMELVARVKSQIRRAKRLNGAMALQANLIEIEDLLINTSTHEVRIGEREIKLTPREFDILVLLARNRGMVFSIEKIYQCVWNEDFYESDNTVMVHIRKIREKLEDEPRKPRFIKTVWGVGYKIEK
ncbi:MAG: response regulator transcription factor [Clostridia bacterium]|nr:response regulator transcription factor [Clostridia bacterium]